MSSRIEALLEALITNSEPPSQPQSRVEAYLYRLCELLGDVSELGNTISNVRYNEETDMVEIYYDGVWIEWRNANLQTLYLYNNGDECLDVSGGYHASDVYGFTVSGSTTTPTITRNANALQVVGTSGRYGSVFSSNAIDLTGYKTAIFKVVDNSASDAGVYIGFSQSKSKGYQGEWVFIGDDTEHELNISNVEGNYYVAMCTVGAANISISEIKLV